MTPRLLVGVLLFAQKEDTGERIYWGREMGSS